MIPVLRGAAFLIGAAALPLMAVADGRDAQVHAAAPSLSASVSGISGYQPGSYGVKAYNSPGGCYHGYGGLGETTFTIPQGFVGSERSRPTMQKPPRGIAPSGGFHVQPPS